MEPNPESQEPTRELTSKARRLGATTKAIEKWKAEHPPGTLVRYYGPATIEGTLHRTVGDPFVERYVGMIRLEGLSKPVRLANVEAVK